MSRQCPFHAVEIPEQTQECPVCIQGENILRSRVSMLIKELENEIGNGRENEYEAGRSSGLQLAITRLEALNTPPERRTKTWKVESTKANGKVTGHCVILEEIECGNDDLCIEVHSAPESLTESMARRIVLMLNAGSA